MRKTSKLKSARRKKIVMWTLVAMSVLFLIRFVFMRATDKNAWPSAAGVRLELSPRLEADSARLATPEDIALVVTNFVPAMDGLVHEYKLYQAQGVTPNSVYPLMDARVTAPEGKLNEVLEFWSKFDGFDPSTGSMHYNSFVGLHAEIGVMACYAADTGKTIAGVSPSEIRVRMMEDSLKLSHGAGLIGRYAALNNIMLVVRELTMTPGDLSDVSMLTNQISRIRAMESKIGSLPDALRADYLSIGVAADAIYDQVDGKGVSEQRQVGAGTGCMIQLLGGTRADTHRHLNALFTRLIQNALSPYTPEGLVVGLPDWCKGKKRPPSTRDPVGAAMAEAYLKHAIFAGAVEPSILLELRAARIVLALNHFKQISGAFPKALNELVTAGLLVETDCVDPFATDVKLLTYARDGEGWRFHSVGLDQNDDAGLIDAYRSTEVKEGQGTDFVFISRERETRLGRLPAAAQAATIAPQAIPEANTPAETALTTDVETNAVECVTASEGE